MQNIVLEKVSKRIRESIVFERERVQTATIFILIPAIFKLLLQVCRVIMWAMYS